jgi:UDP-glucose:(heptosyl)LPS alpha-1,3-glucosyltransferase
MSHSPPTSTAAPVTSGTRLEATQVGVTLVAHDVGEFGGMERQLLNLTTGLLARGHPVTVVARRCDVPPHPRLRFVRVPTLGRPFVVAYPLFAAIATWKVWRHGTGLTHTTGAVVLNKADVVTVHLLHRAIARIPGLIRSSRRARLWRAHGRVAAWMAGLAETWSYRPSRVRRVVAVSSGGLDELVEFFPALRSVALAIPNGVDVMDDGSSDASAKADATADSDRLTALFVGSEWEGKGLRYAIEALVAAPRWNLEVVGKGEQKSFEALATELGVADRVQFHGWHDDVRPFYRRADAFVLPSSYETFSMVSFEAASSGLPLLVGRVRGVSDVVKDGVTGWYVDQDGPDIARRLEALGQAARRLAMGGAAQEIARGMSWDAMVDSYAALYRDLASV